MNSNTKIWACIIVSFFVVILLFIWDFGTPNPLTDITFNPLKTDWGFKNFDINSIIQTLLSAILGFFFTIVIIEFFINKARNKEAEEKRDSRLSAILSLLKIPFLEYARAAKCITNKITVMSQENESITIPIGKDALLDIYNSAPFIDKPFSVTKIEFYLDTVEQLQTAIRSILLNADLSNNPNESELFVNCLNDTYYYLSASKMLISEREENEKAFTIIGDALNMPFKEIAPTHRAFPFVALAKLIEIHDEFFKKILETDYNGYFGIK